MVTTNFGSLKLDTAFKQELNNPSNQEYKELATNVKEDLEKMFCKNKFPNCSVEITGFRSGSIGESNFMFKLSSPDGNSLCVSKFCAFSSPDDRIRSVKKSNCDTWCSFYALNF